MCFLGALYFPPTVFFQFVITCYLCEHLIIICFTHYIVGMLCSPLNPQNHSVCKQQMVKRNLSHWWTKNCTLFFFKYGSQNELPFGVYLLGLWMHVSWTNSIIQVWILGNNLVSFACDSPEGWAPLQSESVQQSHWEQALPSDNLSSSHVPPFLMCVALDKLIFLSFDFLFLILEMLMMPASGKCCNE